MRSWWLGSSLVGAGLLAVPASVFRIDVLAEQCSRWPAQTTALAMGAVYLAALACLTVGWLTATRDASQRSTAFLGAVLIHVVALVAAPPFLSMDPLFYAAIGHVTVAGGDPYLPLASALAGDPLLSLLPESWRTGNSAYFPGFHVIAALLSRAAAGSILTELRLFQALASVCMLAVAAMIGGAVRRRSDEKTAAQAVALVGLCPLVVIEATVGAHNDAVIAVTVAVAVVLLVRGRRLAALCATSLGLLIKASALVPLVVELGALGLRRISPRRVVLLTALALLVGGVMLWQARLAWPRLASFTALIGTIDNQPPHVTHSWESLPRAFAYAILHSPVAVFLLGLLFRAFGATWLAFCAARAARDRDAVIGWLATATYGYYLFFHGYMEGWYLLTLVPLVPFAPAQLVRPIKIYLVAQVAWYPITLWRMCDHSQWAWAAKEIGEGIVATVIPTLALIHAARRPASAGKSDMR